MAGKCLTSTYKIMVNSNTVNICVLAKLEYFFTNGFIWKLKFPLKIKIFLWYL
jgi:hypothetical protein